MRRSVAALMVAMCVTVTSARAFAVDASTRDELVATLDALLGVELDGGGWSFAHAPNARPVPLTAPLRVAERLAAPFGLADWNVVVVRSPGTPAAGLVLLRGYHLTGRAAYLAAARRSGDLLLALQMPSGGWFSEMPAERGRPAPWFAATVRRTTIDDDVTPGGVRFLLALWGETGDPRYLDGALRGVAFLQRAQLASGAWPLLWRPAWKHVWPTFEDLATLNDGATTQAVLALLDAGHRLGRTDLIAAARRAGDWLAAVRTAAPQAGWAQQYDDRGRPAAARHFEGVALASWESRLAIDALLTLATATGDERYCAPIPDAVAWLARSAIGPRCWARFYAIGTNTPLYFDEHGARVASTHDAHQPYDWTGEFGIASLLVRVGYEDDPVADREPQHLPGDPGRCDVVVPHFDPTGIRDPRTLIAHAGVLLSLLEPPPPSACRLDQPRNMKSAAATRQTPAAR